MTVRKKNTKKNSPLSSYDFSVLDWFPEGIYILDKKFHYVYVNSMGADLAQISIRQMLGKRPQDLFGDAHKLAFGKTLAKVMKDHNPRTIEAYYPRHNKWYQNNMFPLGEYVAILARDISDKLQAETDQLRLAAIVSSSDDAIVSKNLNSIVTSWNTSAEKMLGYSSEEMIGKSIRTIIPPELQNEEDVILAKLRKGQRISHFQTLRMTKEGRRIPVSLTISPIKNAAGKTIGASKIIRDISQIKNHEENLAFLAAASKELALSLDYQKTLHKVAQLAVPHIADWCSIEMLNEQGQLDQVTLAHKDPEKIKWAKELRAKQPPDMHAKVGLPQVLRTGKTALYPFIDEKLLEKSAKNKKELKLLKKLQLTSLIMTPILAQGKPIGAISFITTESRKRYTQADVAMAEELASRAALAIENARLYQEIQQELVQRKKLEKQKDTFIGVASHELKTPITSIKSFAQLLYYKFKKAGNQQDAALLGKLDAQVDKLTNLVGDLLDMTKMETGNLVFHTDMFVFDDLITEVVEEMQRTTRKHTLRIKGKTRKKFIGDRERIGQILTNLIANAIKYSPKISEIIVHTSIEKGYIKVCVQDFGVGIAKDKQEKVFQRFFRVSGPDSETYPGLGLGLYISSQIIKQMKGKIWVESIEGKGSSFYFTLPLPSLKKRS